MMRDPAHPVASPIRFDLSAHGYRLIVTDTGSSDTDLTDEYAAIRAEMQRVATFFGGSTLREVDRVCY